MDYVLMEVKTWWCVREEIPSTLADWVDRLCGPIGWPQPCTKKVAVAIDYVVCVARQPEPLCAGGPVPLHLPRSPDHELALFLPRTASRCEAWPGPLQKEGQSYTQYVVGQHGPSIMSFANCSYTVSSPTNPHTPQRR